MSSSHLQKVAYGALAALGTPSLLRRYHRGKAAVLMYHSIVDQCPIAWTQVHVDMFRQQMAYLKSATTVLSMPELVSGLTSGHLPSAATAVTFDDGFKNFATLALPILEEFEIPATVYLTTSFIDGQNEFQGLIWPDYVHAILLATRKERLDLMDLSLASLDLSSEASRHRAKALVCQKLKALPTERRLECIQALVARADTVILDRHREMFRGMSWLDIQAIDKKGLIDFGAHTVSHVILSQTCGSAMRREILDSKRLIEGKVGHAIDHFAYPNGTPDDYNESVLGVVREAFDSAVTTTEQLVFPTADLYELPRLGVGSDMFFAKFKLFVSGIKE